MHPSTGATPKTLEDHDEHDTLMALGFPAPPACNVQPPKRLGARMQELAEEDRGAVTAEYALIIMAAVAFAGLLITILRSDEVRAMLVNLVQTALGSAG